MEFNNLTVELDVQRKIYNTLSHQYEVLKLTYRRSRHSRSSSSPRYPTQNQAQSER